jgi:glucose-6-phosphate 1-epimerase
MDVAELQEQFGVPGALGFGKTPSGMLFVRVTTSAANATVYVQGAHLTDWQPKGQKPVLFLSAKSDLSPAKAIRGGVPVCFPWFGPRSDGKKGPSHGFARTEDWELKFAAIVGDAVRLTWVLGPNAVSRELGFDRFQVAYEMTIGEMLRLQMTVANDSGEPGMPLVFEEALHTYFAVADAEQVEIDGLGETSYLDKVDGMQQKIQRAGALRLTDRTDRVYLNTTATCALRDEAGGRKIMVEKMGSHSTVVWNPWAELTATMSDMEPEGWRGMTCIETANVGESAKTLAPGETHTMRATISVEAMG